MVPCSIWSGFHFPGCLLSTVVTVGAERLIVEEVGHWFSHVKVHNDQDKTFQIVLE